MPRITLTCVLCKQNPREHKNGTLASFERRQSSRESDFGGFEGPCFNEGAMKAGPKTSSMSFEIASRLSIRSLLCQREPQNAKQWLFRKYNRGEESKHRKTSISLHATKIERSHAKPGRRHGAKLHQRKDYHCVERYSQYVRLKTLRKNHDGEHTSRT